MTLLHDIEEESKISIIDIFCSLLDKWKCLIWICLQHWQSWKEIQNQDQIQFSWHLIAYCILSVFRVIARVRAKVSLGCHNKNTIDWMTLNNRNVFFHSSRGWDHGQMLVRTLFPCRQLPSCCVLRGVERRVGENFSLFL